MATTYYKHDQDAIFDIMQNCGGVYWKVHNGLTTNGSLLYFNDAGNNHANSMPSSQAKLKKFLNQLPLDAVVHISFSQKSTAEKGRGGNNNFETKLVYQNSEPPVDHYAALMGAQPAPAQVDNSHEIERYYSLQMESFKKEMALQQQINDLKRELKEAKEGSPTEALIGQIAPLLINKFGGGQVAAPQAPAMVNGAPSEFQQDLEASELSAHEAQLENIVAELYALEGANTVEHLDLLLKLRQQNEPMYKQAIDLAKSLVK